MKIEPIVFQVFYEILCKEVARKQHKGNKEKYVSLKSRQLWKTFPEEDFARFLGGDTGKSVQYFFRIAEKLDPKKIKGKREIDDKLMLNGLMYIATKPTLINVGKIIGSRKKLDYLQTEFMEKYKNEIATLEADYGDLNQETIKETPTHVSKIYKNVNFEIVTDLLHSYFENISKSNYGLAWDQLSYSNKAHKWNDSFEDFKRKQVPPFRDIKVFDHVQKAPDQINCVFYLTYQCSTFESEDIRRFSDYRVADLDKFYKEVKDLVDKYLSMKVYQIRDVLLYELFKSVPKDFEFRAGVVTKEENSNSFGILDVQKVTLLIGCDCVFEKRWLINSIHFPPYR